MALIVRLDFAKALRLAAECPRAVQVRVVVDLAEGLERNTQALGVVHHAVMVVGDAPRTGVDVQVLIKIALLGEAAEFGVPIAATQAPISPPGPSVVFEDLNLVTGIAQLVSGGHPGHTRAENQHTGALGRRL